jgi:endonuclease/exonuclease/phosphatase family metal-dependent hydrolase
MKARQILSIAVLALVIQLFQGCWKTGELVNKQPLDFENCQEGASIWVASWNVLHLGWENQKNIKAVAAIIDRYDLVALIEVMNHQVVDDLIIELERISPDEWEAVMTDAPVGRTRYRENYVIVYRSAIVRQIDTGRIISDEQDVFEREPFVVSFKADNLDFRIVVIHTDFSPTRSTVNEINQLFDLLDGVRDHNVTEPDIILVGDFNREPHLPEWNRYFDAGWKALFISPTKTTIGSNRLSRLYDNIWVTAATLPDICKMNGQPVTEVFNFVGQICGDYDECRETISDHLPVAVRLRTDRDND